MKRIIAAGCVVTSLAAPVAAQDNDWQYTATLYGWLPSLSTSVETSFGTIESSSSSSDALSDLDMAFMGAFEASNGKWIVVGDLLYTDLTSSEDTPLGALFSDVEVSVKVAALTGYLAYRVYDSNGVAIDLGGGFRAVQREMVRERAG